MANLKEKDTKTTSFSSGINESLVIIIIHTVTENTKRPQVRAF